MTTIVKPHIRRSEHTPSRPPRRPRRAGPPAWARWLIVAAGAGLAVLVIGAGLLAGMAVAFSRQLPDVSALYNPPDEATRIYAASGELVASLYRENRDSIQLSQIPDVLQQAVLAVEDDRFYQHRGVDARAITRAVWRNFLAGRLEEGASTITQQLARTLFLTQDRTIARKLAEAILALEIERHLTKDEILERYLNQVYFGQGAYGIEMAARVYLGKNAKNLNLAESAMLAGVIQAPSVLTPFQNYPGAKARQRVVLSRMVELGYISEATAKKAGAQKIVLAKEGNAGLYGVRAPYFISYILPYLLDRYGEDLVYKGGLRIYTTLDIGLQIAGERAVRSGIDAARAANLNVSQGALVALDPRTGYIRAMIGGYDFKQSQFNRAWQARRQPGSAFKPFIYTAALASGMTPSKIIVDGPVSYDIPGFRVWRPRNYDGRFRGPVTLRYAVEHSINIPAVKTLAEIGPTRVIEVAKRMGITSPLQPNLSLALGTSDVTPLEMASAYGTLATMGLHARPVAIVKILDRSGQVLEEHPPQRELVLSEEVAYVMTTLLKGVITQGTGRAAAIGRPAAGKTGTTDDYRNAWFAGYTPYLSTAVWVGNDNNAPMRRVVGGMVPARIWASFMKGAVTGTPADDWKRPEGVVTVTVCGASGQLASAGCPNPRTEVFIRGTEPTEYYVPPAPVESENGGATGSLPLSVTMPQTGQMVTSPFAIEGITSPGTTISLSVLAEGGFLRVKVAETFLPVTADGRFSYTFRPTLRVSGVRYIITITVTSPGGGRSSTTLTVTEQ
ncbi:MAG TPA: penicillin-binding protein 1A [bacterium]|jgi:penicillin-binding protein 1A|nr:penicillin-binding protein 1A [bacterium]